MRTPRPQYRPPRGIGTLVGNGWLHERPVNPWAREGDARSRSALRKCQYIPIPPWAACIPALAAPPAPLVRTPPRAYVEPTAEVRRRDPRRDVRAFPAIDPAPVHKRRVIPAAAPAPPAPPRQTAEEARAWWEDPVALGSLLILAPPVGLAALWSSKRYGSDARWALTVMTALTLCLVTSVVVALLVR